MAWRKTRRSPRKTNFAPQELELCNHAPIVLGGKKYRIVIALPNALGITCKDASGLMGCKSVSRAERNPNGDIMNPIMVPLHKRIGLILEEIDE